MIKKNPSPGHTFNPWHFIWITVVISELFTALMNTIQHHFSPEMDLRYLLKVGAIDSLFVPLLVAPVIIYFLRSASILKKINVQLEQEIAERKEVTKALKESQERYHALFDQSPDGILLIDPDGNLAEFNESAYRQLGYTGEEFKKLSISDINALESPDDVRDRVRNIFAAGRAEFEVLHKTKDGKLRDVQVISQAIDLSDRMFLHSIWRDVTERKQAEDALRVSEEQYRNLVDNASVGIYKANFAGRFLYVNKALATTFEFDSPQEMTAENILLRYRNPEDRAAFLDELKKNGEVNNFELDTVSKTGKTIHLLLNATLRDGIISGMVLNITEQKKLQAQLRHAQKMEAIGTLAGGIAHDFNNILNVVMGYGSMVLDSMEPGDPSKGHMNEVLAAADRAANLTKRLLAFSRKQAMETKPVNVNEIIRGLEKMLSRIIGEDIVFTTELTDQNLMVMADMGQIEQVLMNLASNARDAMPKGGRLTIGTGTKEVDDEYIAAYGYGKTGTYALISVTDTGHGIDKETQKKIFEPFFTTKGVGEGTGLGLSIAYGIIKRHNGYITVYSEEGKGASFKILFPLIQVETLKRQGSETAPAINGGTETILVAEDDAALRTLSRIVLESFGYAVITAEDGEDAVNKFLENREAVQLVVLDMLMPKKNGKEVYEEIKKISSDVRTLFVSGYAMDIINKKHLLDEGMDFLLKPVSPKDLVRKVREVLDSP